MSEPLKIGTLINHGEYRIGKVLGTGGFSIVYQGFDFEDKIFAIKEVFDRERCFRARDGCQILPKPDVNKAFEIHERQMQRAREEFERFGTVNHPNLVTPHKLVEDYGTVYIVLPFVKGEQFHDFLLHSKANKTAEYVAELIFPLMDAVSLIHSMGVIHRDIKPDNVLISTSSGKTTPFLLDTGAARSFGDENQLHTGIITPFGAPEIISPAEAKTHGEPGPWTDTFALSGLIFLIYTGLRPLGYQERITEIVLAKRADPFGKPALLDETIWRLVKKGLSLSTKDRYQNVAELKEALGLAMRGIASELPVNETHPTAGVADRLVKPPTNTTNDISTAGNGAAWGAAIVLSLACAGLTGLLVPDNGLVAALLFTIVHICIAIGLIIRHPAGKAPVFLVPFYNIYLLLFRK